MEKISISDVVTLPDGYEQNEQNNENLQEIEVRDGQRIDSYIISLTESNQSQSRENNSDSIDESLSIKSLLFPFEEKNSEYDGDNNDEQSGDTSDDRF